MGDISIIARRLEDGHVQYGWSGNGGYFETVGLRLLLWYQNPEDVEYLFEFMFRVELFRNSLSITQQNKDIEEASEKHRRNIKKMSRNKLK